VFVGCSLIAIVGKNPFDERSGNEKEIDRLLRVPAGRAVAYKFGQVLAAASVSTT